MVIRKNPMYDTETPPGQYSQSFDRYQYIPKTLGEMIDNTKKHEELMLKEKKKLTFDEWFGHRYPAGLKCTLVTSNDLKDCWNAAQENK